MQPIDFLLVRKSQLTREIKALGLLYSILIAGLAGLFFVFFFKLQVSFQYIAVSGAALTILVLIIHLSRKDHRFISLAVEQPVYIYLTEYGTLILPFLILSWISFGQPLLALSLIPVIIISVIKVTSKPVVGISFTSRLISATNFEWKAGVRKTGVVLLVLWLMALALTGVPFASIIVLWFFLLTVSSFYDEGEPRDMLESFQLGESGFLRKKLFSHMLAFVIPTMPVLFISFLFFPERWWVLLLFLLFSCINMAVFIVSKYAVWRPGEINRSGSIVNAMCMLGLFLPFLLPLPLVVLVRNYRKAIINLKPLLHDYHQ